MAYVFLFLCPFLLSFPSAGFPITCRLFLLCLYPAVLNFNMKISHKQFATLLAPDGPDILFSLYHECLHLIAFTHSKLLSLPHCKFLDPASPVNDDGTVSIQFLPHWHHTLLLPLFLCLLQLYIKLQLRLTLEDYQQVIQSFDNLPPADVSEILGTSSKHLGQHLHIICSITLLELLCLWTPNDSPLDFFLHLGGNPIIILGNILIHDDIQHTISHLVSHVGSPSQPHL